MFVSSVAWPVSFCTAGIVTYLGMEAAPYHLRSHHDWTSTNLGLKHPTTAFILSASFTVWESFPSSFSSPCFAGHSPQQGTLVSCSLWHRWTPLLSLCPAACHAVTWQHQHCTHQRLLCRGGTPAANWGGSPDVQALPCMDRGIT